MKELLKKLFPRNIVMLLKTMRQLAMLPFLLMANKKCADGGNGIVLMRLDGVGDFVLWLDSAKEFRKLHPDSKITVMCTPLTASLARCLGYFDDVVAVDIGKLYRFDLKSIMSVRKKIAKLRCDTLVQCVYSRTFAIDYIAACVPANKKISIDGDSSSTGPVTPGAKYFTDRIYDRLITTPTGVMHELLRSAIFIKGLGLDIEPKLPQIPLLPVNSGVIPEDRYFVVFPGAAQTERSWEIEKFADVIEYVFTKTGYICCVCGSKSEGYLASEIKKLCKERDIVIDMTGKTSLPELIEVIRHAKFVISNDTSAVHVAPAVNTRSICVYGPWTPGKYLPYPNEIIGLLPRVCCCQMPCAGCDYIYTKECYACLKNYGKRLCIHNVSATGVIEILDTILATTKA